MRTSRWDAEYSVMARSNPTLELQDPFPQHDTCNEAHEFLSFLFLVMIPAGKQAITSWYAYSEVPSDGIPEIYPVILDLMKGPVSVK